MNISEVNPGIIGRRVSCIENGTRTVGTIIGISEDEYTVKVRIKFDEPLHCWSGDFNIEEWDEEEYDSWARKSDGTGNLEYTYFVDTLDWLKDYMPEDRHFTNEFEMRDIANNIGLKKMNKEQLLQIRNNVVDYYSSLFEKLYKTQREKAYDSDIAMMSVTAVIDHYRWNAGAEV